MGDSVGGTLRIPDELGHVRSELSGPYENPERKSSKVFKGTEYDVVKSLAKGKRKPAILTYISKEMIRAADEGLIECLKKSALENPPYDVSP